MRRYKNVKGLERKKHTVAGAARASNNLSEAVCQVTLLCLFLQAVKLVFLRSGGCDFVLNRNKGRTVSFALNSKPLFGDTEHTSVRFCRRGNGSYAMFQVKQVLENRKRYPWKTLSYLKHLKLGLAKKM